MRQKNAILYLLYPVDVLHMYIYYVLYMCVFSSEGFPHVFFPAIPWKTSVKAKMRDELMKKFAEDDRLEQVSEHKRRMKAPRDDGATGGASESNEKMGSSLGKTGNNMGFHWQIRNLWWFQQNWSADQLVFRWRNSVWDNVCFDFGCLNSHKSWWRHVTSVLLY